MAEVKIYGIRHHGPGSSTCLLKALELQKPDCILIEGPSDAESALQHFNIKDILPPAAILVYDIKNLHVASYYPFASFSPEWQAMRYGFKKAIPCFFMDLPLGIEFYSRQNKDAQKQMELLESSAFSDRGGRRDPFTELAQTAGYSDSERWWEVFIENAFESHEVFEVVMDLMDELRKNDGSDSASNMLREAHMRKVIRQKIKERYTSIAVVCGAWHAPALRNWEHISAATDNRLLRGWKKVKVNSTWVPWSYTKLANQSGYAAGVVSPEWYEHLFKHRTHAVTTWMTKAGRICRRRKIDTSSAHTIAAVQMAETLRDLRELRKPGLDELLDAATAVFWDQRKSVRSMLQRRMIIGNRTGRIRGSVPMLPLQKDIEKTLKQARLTAYWEKADRFDKTLDLRKATQRKASVFLHRMNLAGILWGRSKAGSPFQTGSFSELWSLKWKVRFSLQIVEAAMFGSTLKEVVVHRSRSTLEHVEDVADLTEFVWAVLKADIPEIFDEVIQKLMQRVGLSTDVAHLMNSLTALFTIWRYGDSRKLDSALTLSYIQQLAPRIYVAFPEYSKTLDEVQIEDLIPLITECTDIMNNVDLKFDIDWNGRLLRITKEPVYHPLLRGFCLRTVMTLGGVESSFVEGQFRRALSFSETTDHSAFWIEGFLSGNASAILYHAVLSDLLAVWVNNLENEDFDRVLPVLRRAFSRFSDSEKNQISRLVLSQPTQAIQVVHDHGRIEKVRNMLDRLL